MQPRQVLSNRKIKWSVGWFVCLFPEQVVDLLFLSLLRYLCNLPEYFGILQIFTNRSINNALTKIEIIITTAAKIIIHSLLHLTWLTLSVYWFSIPTRKLFLGFLIPNPRQVTTTPNHIPLVSLPLYFGNSLPATPPHENTQAVPKLATSSLVLSRKFQNLLSLSRLK